MTGSTRQAPGSRVQGPGPSSQARVLSPQAPGARPQAPGVRPQDPGLRLQASGLADIAERVDAGERLTFDDGVRLFNAPDLLSIGWMANRERERRHGARTYFNHNLR